jgi:hypothetical protein
MVEMKSLLTKSHNLAVNYLICVPYFILPGRGNTRVSKEHVTGDGYCRDIPER